MNQETTDSRRSSTDPTCDPVRDRARAAQRFLPLAAQDGPALPALKSLALAGRDLLRRTAELPDTEQELLLVLAEYRYAIFAFAAVVDKL
jgi:hypothetical protein